MNFRIETRVGQSAKMVLDGFNEDLFLALKPPLMPLELIRFDGCEKGDKVQLVLGIKPLSQKWDALVVEHGEDDGKFYFTDIGETLPFPLKDWKHRHQILKLDDGSIIVDDITYTTGFFFIGCIDVSNNVFTILY